MRTSFQSSSVAFSTTPSPASKACPLSLFAEDKTVTRFPDWVGRQANDLPALLGLIRRQAIYCRTSAKIRPSVPRKRSAYKSKRISQYALESLR